MKYIQQWFRRLLCVPIVLLGSCECFIISFLWFLSFGLFNRFGEPLIMSKIFEKLWK